MSKKALYLAGGGARGAYQAGALQAIATILAPKAFPFAVVSGVSVGSINAAMLASHSTDFQEASEKLATFWASLRTDQIFRASNYEVAKSILRNILHFFRKPGRWEHLLDTSPLQSLIREHIRFEALTKNLQENHIETIEVIANCYEKEQTISFYQHHNQTLENWQYPRHASQQTILGMEHILASCALPLFFPSMEIESFHYGDGSLGLVTPLRCAIRANVDKILIIGTRAFPTRERVEEAQRNGAGFAQILGGILNGIFMDNLDRDIEMVNHMNEIAGLLSLWKKRHSPWRPIETLHLRPSQEIAPLAQAHYHTIPLLLRYILNLLGARKHSGELLSFLLFESPFTKALLEMGYQDTLRQQSKIEAFLKD